MKKGSDNVPEALLSITHDSLVELLHSLTDDDLQYLADRLADKLQQPAQETYTIAELSEKLKLSRDTITDRIRKGEFGNVIRDGRRYRVTAAGLQQYIDQHSGQAYQKQEPPQTQYRRRHVNPGRI